MKTRSIFLSLVCVSLSFFGLGNLQSEDMSWGYQSESQQMGPGYYGQSAGTQIYDTGNLNNMNSEENIQTADNDDEDGPTQPKDNVKPQKKNDKKEEKIKEIELEELAEAQPVKQALTPTEKAFAAERASANYIDPVQRAQNDIAYKQMMNQARAVGGYQLPSTPVSSLATPTSWEGSGFWGRISNRSFWGL